MDIIYTNRTIAVKFLSPDVPGIPGPVLMEGWTVGFHTHPSRYGNIIQVVDSISDLTPLKGCVFALALTGKTLPLVDFRRSQEVENKVPYWKLILVKSGSCVCS